MKEVWEQIFYHFTLFSKKDVLTSYTDDGLYFVSNINYTRNCYEQIMKFVFENYKISKLSFGLDSVNALYSVGKTSGIVVDSGDSSTRILSIFQSHIDRSKIWQMDYAGRDLSEQIKSKLYTLDRRRIYQQANVDAIKENLFHWVEGSKGESQVIDLPDGSQTDLGFEKSLFPSKFFLSRGQLDLTLGEAISWCMEGVDYY